MAESEGRSESGTILRAGVWQETLASFELNPDQKQQAIVAMEELLTGYEKLRSVLDPNQYGVLIPRGLNQETPVLLDENGKPKLKYSSTVTTRSWLSGFYRNSWMRSAGEPTDNSYEIDEPLFW